MDKKQFYEFAIDNDMPLDMRYEAARQLQSKKFKDEMILPLVKLFPHMDIADIANKLNIPPQTVGTMAQRLGLKRRIAL